jgi:hypothetical protein
MPPRNPLISLSLPKIADFRIGNKHVSKQCFRMDANYIRCPANHRNFPLKLPSKTFTLSLFVKNPKSRHSRENGSPELVEKAGFPLSRE